MNCFTKFTSGTALESQRVCNNPTRPKIPLYTEGHRDIVKDWNAHDGLQWKQASDKEFSTLGEKKKYWKIIKIKDVPRDKNLSWFLLILHVVNCGDVYFRS